MARLIDANALLDDVDVSLHDNPHTDGIVRATHKHEHNHFMVMIMQAPTVDAVEVVHGRWVPTYHTYYNREGASQIADEWHCSECGIYSRSEWNYCPNCGARMDGDSQ